MFHFGDWSLPPTTFPLSMFSLAVHVILLPVWASICFCFNRSWIQVTQAHSHSIPGLCIQGLCHGWWFSSKGQKAFQDAFAVFALLYMLLYMYVNVPRSILSTLVGMLLSILHVLLAVDLERVGTYSMYRDWLLCGCRYQNLVLCGSLDLSLHSLYALVGWLVRLYAFS